MDVCCSAIKCSVTSAVSGVADLGSLVGGEAFAETVDLYPFRVAFPRKGALQELFTVPLQHGHFDLAKDGICVQTLVEMPW